MSRPFQATLAVEGQETTDGRLIVPGALTWPESPIPLTLPDGTQIGVVTRIWRDGNEILCEGEGELPGPGYVEELRLGLSCYVGRWSSESEFPLRLLEGEIAGAAVMSAHDAAFPDARIRMSGPPPYTPGAEGSNHQEGAAMAHHLEEGKSEVRAQYTIDGVHYKFHALVTEAPARDRDDPSQRSDPDLVRLSVLSTVESEGDLLSVGWNHHIHMKHGAQREHGTFRYNPVDGS